MSKVKIFKTFFYISLMIALYFLFTYLGDSILSQNKVILNVLQSEDVVYQIFYKENNTQEFSEENSISINVKGSEKMQNIKVSLPISVISAVRIDFGDVSDKITEIKNIKIGNLFKNTKFNPDNVMKDFEKVNTKEVYVDEQGNLFIVTDVDSNIINENLNLETITYLSKIIGFALAIIITFIVYKFIYIRTIYNLFMGLYQNRELILKLAINDFKTKYSGSYFGIVWAFVQPIMTILTFWFVFQVGFRSAPVKGFPFILWFTSGLIPWFYFSDGLTTATNSFIEYSYLVKKVVFNINILPVVKMLSALFVHIFFAVLLIVIFWVYGYPPTWYTLQVFYYVFALSVYLIALSFLTSSIMVFFKDFGPILGIILQFGMWLTPIMWSIDMVPEKYIWIFKLNPLYYIILGYRESLLLNSWFFNNVKQTIYFWFVTGLFTLIGAFIYKKLKPHFADVL